MVERTLVSVDTGRRKPYELEITTQDVVMRGLPAALHGATIAHITDLHGGFGNTEPVYEEVLSRVNAARPDYILFTGDYIDDHARDRDYPIQEVLRRFCAKRGVFGVFGNHDHRRDVERIRPKLEQAGVHILENTNVRLEGNLFVAGVDDLEEGRPDIAATLDGLPADATTIVLSHNPRLIERVQGDYFILSGHTHGGQIRFPYVLTGKAVCMIHLRCRQVDGWYENGKARLYISRGVGVTGQPYRINCPAEVALFRLVPDAQSALASTEENRTTAAVG